MKISYTRGNFSFSLSYFRFLIVTQLTVIEIDVFLNVLLISMPFLYGPLRIVSSISVHGKNEKNDLN